MRRITDAVTANALGEEVRVLITVKRSGSEIALSSSLDKFIPPKANFFPTVETLAPLHASSFFA
jgi:hypothetical protein